MSIARDLAEYLARVSFEDLPPQAIEHAAMLIASTIASAACGKEIASRRRSSATWRASAAARPKPRCGSTPGRTAGRRGGAGQRGDERRRGLRRQRPAQHRPCRHAVDRDRACPGRADRRRAARTCWRRSSSATRRRGASARRSPPAFATAGFTAACRDLCRRGRRRAAAAARRGAAGAGDRARRDLDRRADGRGEHQRRARISCRARGAARHRRGARRAARLSAPKRRILEARHGFLRGLWRHRRAAARRRRAISGESWDIVTDMAIKLVPGGHPYHALCRGRRQCGERRQHRARRGREHHRLAPRLHRA